MENNSKTTETIKFILLGFLAILTLAVPISFSRNNILVLFLIALVSFLMCLIKPKFSYLAVFAVGFIFGTMSEIIAIHYGLWSYRDVFMYGVPIYLPFVWGNASLYILGVYDFVKQYEN